MRIKNGANVFFLTYWYYYLVLYGNSSELFRVYVDNVKIMIKNNVCNLPKRKGEESKGHRESKQI
jgi:hypothetical protein